MDDDGLFGVVRGAVVELYAEADLSGHRHVGGIREESGGRLAEAVRRESGRIGAGGVPHVRLLALLRRAYRPAARARLLRHRLVWSERRRLAPLRPLPRRHPS